MSRMNELSICLDELKTAVSMVDSAIKTLTEMFSAEEPVPAAPAPKPISKEDVRAVLAGKSAEGYAPLVRNLLHQFDAAQLSDVDPADYPSLMLMAQAIGNEVGADG